MNRRPDVVGAALVTALTVCVLALTVTLYRENLQNVAACESYGEGWRFDPRPRLCVGPDGELRGVR